MVHLLIRRCIHECTNVWSKGYQIPIAQTNIWGDPILLLSYKMERQTDRLDEFEQTHFSWLIAEASGINARPSVLSVEHVRGFLGQPTPCQTRAARCIIFWAVQVWLVGSRTDASGECLLWISNANIQRSPQPKRKGEKRMTVSERRDETVDHLETRSGGKLIATDSLLICSDSISYMHA